VFVMFVVFSFFAYAAVTIPLPLKGIRYLFALQAATFSGLIVLAFSIPLSNASVGIAIQSVSYVGVWGAIAIYLIMIFGLLYVIYSLMTRAMMTTLDRMTPH